MVRNGGINPLAMAFPPSFTQSAPVLRYASDTRRVIRFALSKIWKYNDINATEKKRAVQKSRLWVDSDSIQKRFQGLVVAIREEIFLVTQTTSTHFYWLNLRTPFTQPYTPRHTPAAV